MMLYVITYIIGTAIAAVGFANLATPDGSPIPTSAAVSLAMLIGGVAICLADVAHLVEAL